jgi:hypothetical protein
MVCSTKVGAVVRLEDCIYLSVVCGVKKIAEFCLHEAEYEVLGEPKPGDVVVFTASSERRLELRFLGRPKLLKNLWGREESRDTRP